MAFTRPRASQINFDTTNITDTLIRINSSESGDNANDLGIIFERGNHTNAAIVWDESADAFRLISTTHDASTTTSDINISAHHNLHVGALETTGNVTVGGNLTVTGTTTTVDVASINITNSFSFEGATPDGFETTLTVADPTADRTITLPDVTGYAAILQSDPGTTLITATVAELNYVDGVTSNIQTQIDNISSSFTLSADSGTNDTFTTGEILTIAGGTGIDTTVSDNNISIAIDSTVATLTGTQTLTNKTINTASNTITIVEADISDFGTYLTASDITGKLNLSGGTMSGAIAMGTNKITGMGDPTAAQDAATKAYVDSQVSSVPTGDITAVNITAGTGLSGTVSTASGDHTQTLSIDSTVATLTGSQTLTNKTLTAPVISSISNTGTLTLPTSTGTIALTSDIPTAVSELTNDSGYSTTTGTVTSVAGTGTVNGLTLTGTVTSSGSLTLGGTFSATVSEISDLTATAAELNVLDGIPGTLTATELGYVDGVTSAIQTQLDAKAPLAAPAFTGTATGVNLTLSGDLTVNGTTTTVNTTNLVVSDNLIELNNGAASNANDSGIVIERGSTGDNAIFAWDESADAFVMGTTTATGASTGDLTITNGELRLDTLRIDQSGTGLRMTNVGAFDNDGSNNFRVFATNDLKIAANGQNGTAITIDATNQDVTITNDLRVSAGQFYYGGTAVTSTAAEINKLDGMSGTAVGTTDTQTLTNKTLTAPVISSISNTGTLTLPTTTGTVALTSDIPTAVSELTNDSGYITASTTDTLTNKTLTSPQVNTNIDLLAQADLRLYDADSSNYVGFQAPATATGNILWTLPGSDGTEGQVLGTNGGGTLTWEDPGSGGGSGSSYPNSTFSTVPGTNGDFDLSYNVAQTTQETPFESGGTDAFGVNLGSVFSLMDPIGSLESIDYGDSEAYVGA